MQKTQRNIMSKKKYWTGSLDPNDVAAIIVGTNSLSNEVDIETILPLHIRSYFSKVIVATQVVKFGLVQPMLSLLYSFLYKSLVLIEGKSIKKDVIHGP